MQFLETPQFDALTEFTAEHLQALTRLTTKQYGERIFAAFTVKEGLRCLLTSSGFTVFIAPELFHLFDEQADRYLTLGPHEQDECWIARGTWAFVKLDVQADQLGPAIAAYADPDIEVRKRKVHEFALRNFVNNPQLFPGKEYFTIGSYLREPEKVRPMRYRRGGDFRVVF
jgi:hypothetical protein